MAIIIHDPGEYGGLVATMLDAQSALEPEMRCLIDWDGNTGIPCSAGPAMHGKEMNVHGNWVIVRKVKIDVRVEEFPDENDLPKTNDTLTLYLSTDGPGVKYRIHQTENSFNAVLKLICVDTNHD